jgi:hypothetical protein
VIVGDQGLHGERISDNLPSRSLLIASMKVDANHLQSREMLVIKSASGEYATFAQRPGRGSTSATPTSYQLMQSSYQFDLVRRDA